MSYPEEQHAIQPQQQQPVTSQPNALSDIENYVLELDATQVGSKNSLSRSRSVTVIPPPIVGKCRKSEKSIYFLIFFIPRFDTINNK